MACVGAELCMSRGRRRAHCEAGMKGAKGTRKDHSRRPQASSHWVWSGSKGIRKFWRTFKQGTSRIWLPLLKDHVWLNGP